MPSDLEQARQYEIDESAGDIIVIKAVVLAPNYMPKQVENLTRVLSYGVHAIYSICVWNVPNRRVTQGVLLSHRDIIVNNHIDTEKVIGFYFQEADRIYDYKLLPERSWKKILTDGQRAEIENELTKLKW